MKATNCSYVICARAMTVLGLVFFVVWIATGHSLAPEQELAKLFTGVYNYPEYNIFRCGDYFASGLGRQEGLAYLPKSLGSIPRQIVDEFKASSFRVIVDSSKDVPTAQIGGYLGGQVIVRISQSDFDKAPCLKEVSLHN